MSRREGMRRFVSRVAYVLVVPAALSMVFGVAYGFVVGLGAVGRGVGSGESIEPSQKARVLAEGISEAMNFDAFGLAIGLVAALWLLFCRWRWRRSSSPPSGSE